MKIKSIVFEAVMCTCLVMSGCQTVDKINTETKENVSMFVLVENAPSWKVVYHEKTKVMYVVSDREYNRGNFTLLVNADGTPMLWDGEQ